MNIFDHIYIINLDKREDRWSKVQKVVEHFSPSTKYTRIPAVEMQPGWKGCYASHIKFLEKMLEDGHERALVLEDDAELFEDWNPIWNVVQSQIPDFDILYLGYNLDPVPTNFKNPDFVNTNIIKMNGCLTTHAYVVSKPSLQRLYEEVVSKRIEWNATIDITYGYLAGDFNFYGIYPMIFNQLSGYSDINNNVVNYTLRENVRSVLGK